MAGGSPVILAAKDYRQYLHKYGCGVRFFVVDTSFLDSTFACGALGFCTSTQGLNSFVAMNSDGNRASQRGKGESGRVGLRS